MPMKMMYLNLKLDLTKLTLKTGINNRVISTKASNRNTKKKKQQKKQKNPDKFHTRRFNLNLNIKNTSTKRKNTLMK